MVWLFVGVWGFSEIGVRFVTACAVTTGRMVSLLTAILVSRRETGGLWRAPQGVATA